MIKVLIVASGNSGKTSPFVQDQINDLRKEGIHIEKLLIKGKGLTGYLSNYKKLLKEINNFHPDIIHAHYGLSGLLAVLQRKIPVVVTFHGSDINESNKNRFLSGLASKLSRASIFVSKELSDKLKIKDPIIIPCGVNMNIFNPTVGNVLAKSKLGLDENLKYILFSSDFSKQVKNYPLAKEAISKIKGDNIKLIELKGYSRNEVSLLLNAVDVALLTSFSEGSPQFIKEAMACNVPVVSTDVGDVKEIIGKTEGCYITLFDSEDVANKIKLALEYGKRTNGRQYIKHFESSIIAKKIIEVYISVLNKKITTPINY